MRVLVIQNCEAEDHGHYVTYLQQRGLEYDVIQAYRADADLGAVADYDVLLVGGTPISIREVDQHEFLCREWTFLQEPVQKGMPCFGVCGGGQLLARLLGAEVRKHPEMEIGCYDVRLTPHGESDPLLRGFPPRFPVFQWHLDTFDVPKGASLLAESDLCKNQLFRRGTIVGVQFHLEVIAADVALWADLYAHELDFVNKDKHMVVEECRKHERQMRQLCNLLMNNFFSLIG